MLIESTQSHEAFWDKRTLYHPGPGDKPHASASFFEVRIPYFCPPTTTCVVENNAGTTIQLQALVPHCYYEKTKSVVAKTKISSEEVA